METSHESQRVDASWDRIAAWLRRHVPEAAAQLGPPAAESELAEAESAVGRPLPADLTAWWRRSCGMTGAPLVELVPLFTPFSIEAALECRNSLLRICGGDGTDSADLAGTPAWDWHAAWLPIAYDGGGWYLFCDLRPGPMSGCVTRWMREDAALHGPEWESVGAMLADAAASMDRGIASNDWRAQVDEDGGLTWEP